MKRLLFISSFLILIGITSKAQNLQYKICINNDTLPNNVISLDKYIPKNDSDTCFFNILFEDESLVNLPILIYHVRTQRLVSSYQYTFFRKIPLNYQLKMARPGDSLVFTIPKSESSEDFIISIELK